MNRKMAFEPGIRELLDVERMNSFDDLRVAMPGEIQEFDPAKMTVKVKPAFSRIMSSGEVVAIPQLVDVPVFTLQGGKAHVKLPISKGDECLLIFADSSIDTWFENGGQQAPPHDRMHSLADGFAIVGFNSQVRALISPIDDADEAGIGSKDGASEAAVAVKPSTGKIRIQNQTESLLAILSDLVTVLKGIQVEGPIPLTSVSIAAINAFTLRLEALLYKKI